MRPLRLAFVAALAAACSGNGPAAPGPGSADPREVLVRLAPGVAIETIHARYGTRTIDGVDAERVYLLGLPEDETLEELLPRLVADPDLRAAGPNGRIDAPEAEGRSTIAFADPSLVEADFADQDALARIQAPEAWDETRGAGVIVAVLDTGIDASHPQLQGRIAAGGVDLLDGDDDPSEGTDGFDSDGDGLVDEAVGHGTFVAGLVLSVAPEARILPVRVLDSDGVGTAFDVARGIDHARRQGAKVINLSLGMAGEADPVADLIDEMADEGVVFVGSAGNQAVEGPRHFPAGENDVIGVAATDATDLHASFTNLGSWVDVAAPGVGLVSLYPGQGFATWSGTSFAAALVSGQAALLVSLRPTGRSDDVRDAIARSATRLEDPSLGGAGRIDVPEAIRWLLER